MGTKSAAEATPETLRTAVDRPMVVTARRPAARRVGEEKRTSNPSWDGARNAGLVTRRSGRWGHQTTAGPPAYDPPSRWCVALPNRDMGTFVQIVGRI
ncbi:hypothetical protein GCM10028783_42770 [Modestobacter muralis]